MDVTVITTYRCDSKCSMCYIWKYPTAPSEEVSLKSLEKLPGGIDNLNVTGGEPTLRKDLMEICEILHPKAKKLEISSNGLNASVLEPIIKRFPHTKVRFSLEGFELTNNKIRGEEDGFNKKVNGLRRLKELGGTDLGFATVIQDDNVQELAKLYQLTRKMGVELATSALHNAFQFHKSDNIPYNRTRVAREIQNLITEMLRTNSVKNWFRAYLNLGLMEKVLGHDRLIECTAATDFIFVDPWSDVYACNVRPDLLTGNLEEQSWEEVFNGPKAVEIRKKVAACTQNCWMVTTARTAMRNPRLTFLPKLPVMAWVVLNKAKVTLGRDIDFDAYIDFNNIRHDLTAPDRPSYLGIPEKRKLHKKEEVHYTQFGEFFNR
ncbi:MAG TPA: radical SAM/SPASM domain-containing protein [Bacteroidota bacterium]|nr:radical SAM/SPASM domain-containing protein [Bacteroidota bacterium]